MTRIIASVLRHRRLVALTWVALTIAGALTVSQATSRMTYSYTTPEQVGYESNLHLTQRFGIDGTFEPTLAMLRLPSGETMRRATGQAAVARTFAAASRPGIAAVADYANAHTWPITPTLTTRSWSRVTPAPPGR